MAEATHLLGLPRKHKPKDISPQGTGSGLDADKLDGQHYDKQATAPSSPADGDLWFDTTIKRIKIWVSEHHSWAKILLEGDDSQVYAIVSCRVGASSSSSSWAVVNNSEMLLNVSDFPSGAKAIIRVTWKNSIAELYNWIRLWDQFGSAVVSGSTMTGSAVDSVWYIRETATPFSLPAGLKAFQISIKAGSGTMTIAKVELQIEKG